MVKKGLTDLVVLELKGPLMVEELDFRALRGRRGGSIAVVLGWGGADQ